MYCLYLFIGMAALGVVGLQGFRLQNTSLQNINKLEDEGLELLMIMIKITMKMSGIQESVVLNVRIFFMSLIIPKKRTDVKDRAK